MKLICLAGEGPVHDAMTAVIAMLVLTDTEQHVVVSMRPAMPGVQNALGAAAKLEAAAEFVLYLRAGPGYGFPSVRMPFDIHGRFLQQAWNAVQMEIAGQ